MSIIRDEMSIIRDRVIKDIIHIEGGYVNDPSDSGKETNFGITKRTARNVGYLGEMKDLPVELARSIYQVTYWDKLRLDYIAGTSVRIAEELMDTGVNQGVEVAGKYLQRSLNVLNNKEKYYSDIVVDGVVGHNTLTAFRDFSNRRTNHGVDVLFRMLNCMQGAFYVELAERRLKDEKFIFGWFLNRVR